MEIIKLSEYSKSNELYKMWNDEYGFIFPITKELFNKNVFEYGLAAIDNSFVAVIEEEALGFIIGKTWNEKIDLPSYDDLSWISLMYVKPSFRKRGIGSLLLEKVEEIFKKQNKKIINLGKDYYNFFPGLPVELKIHRAWFEKRGYHIGYDTNDLIKKVESNTKKEVLKPFKDNKNYIIRRATKNDFEGIDKLIKDNWPGRWYMEFVDYVSNGGTGHEYMICINESGIVCGFCKVCDINTNIMLNGYSMNFYDLFKHLSGIGPLGVDINYRKLNIANNILKNIINELLENGTTEIIIDWTNLMHIYQKYGFEIWKSYTYTYKELNK
jgi:GNAT superfamily N-acetyltransferase